MVVATYTINDKRKKRVSFAGPYYTAGQDIMVAKDDTSITGPESLRPTPTTKVCSVTGSTPSENDQEVPRDPPTQLVLFDVYSKCADALRTGQVNAVTTDNVILLGLASSQPTARSSWSASRSPRSRTASASRRATPSSATSSTTTLKKAADVRSLREGVDGHGRQGRGRADAPTPAARTACR